MKSMMNCSKVSLWCRYSFHIFWRRLTSDVKNRNTEPSQEFQDRCASSWWKNQILLYYDFNSLCNLSHAARVFQQIFLFIYFCMPRSSAHRFCSRGFQVEVVIVIKCFNLFDTFLRGQHCVRCNILKVPRFQEISTRPAYGFPVKLLI